MAKRKSNTFLPRIYLTREEDTDGSFFFIVHKSIDEVPSDDAGNKIGVYQFVEQKTLAVTQELI